MSTISDKLEQSPIVFLGYKIPLENKYNKYLPDHDVCNVR